MRKTILTTIMLATALAVPSAALAQSSTSEGYGDVGPNVQTNIEPGSGGGGGETKTSDPTSPASVSTPVASTPRNTAVVDALPFTGADLLNILGAGVVLVGLGLGLRYLLVRDRRTDGATARS